jgi:hypothetical protein
MHYILDKDGKTPIHEPDILEWAKWMEANKTARIVKKTRLSNGVEISTVFLGYTTALFPEFIISITKYLASLFSSGKISDSFK